MLNRSWSDACAVVLVEDLSQQRLPARWMAAALRQAGLSARLVHCGSAADAGALPARLHALQPRLVVLSLLFGHLLDVYLGLAARLRSESGAWHLTLAGPLPALDPARFLTTCPALDSVVCGEPEAVLPRLAARLVDGADWRDVPGLAWRSPDVRVNPPPWPALDLDNLPEPVRDDGIPQFQGVGFATVEGSRVCYHRCSFCLPCAHHRDVVGAPYRLRSIPNLVDEMERLYARGVRLFLFDDEQFLPPQPLRAERVRGFADELRRRRMHIAFTIKCRADDVDADLLRRLQDVGLIRVYLGLESGCPETLERLHKGVTVTQNAAALATLDRLGLVADFRCLIFHPWSTLATVAREIDFLATVLPLVPTVVTYCETVCYAGTPMHAELVPAPANAAVNPTDGGVVYEIGDAAVEWLRCRARPVIAAQHAPQGSAARVTRAWYDLLLSQRFAPTPDNDRAALALRRRVLALNAAMLDVWRALLPGVGG